MNINSFQKQKLSKLCDRQTDRHKSGPTSLTNGLSALFVFAVPTSQWWTGSCAVASDVVMSGFFCVSPGGFQTLGNESSQLFIAPFRALTLS